MIKSSELLKDHPINQKRIKEGKNPATSLWFWGEGTKPALQKFIDRYGIKGCMISAVDLLKGIGMLTEMKVVEVEGATGNYDTNFSGKAEACINALKEGVDFVYIHMEAPDECGHHGDLEHKIFSIGEISKKVVKPVIEYLDRSGEDYKVLICPDHPTPISIKTHCAKPVPFVIYDSKNKVEGLSSYTEENAKKSGIVIDSGVSLMQKFLCK